MFQFRPFPSYAYLIQRTMLEYCSSGFPHSEIHGLTDICSSPWLIAACHVLLRLLMPRHSPCALYSLTYRIIADSQLNYAGNLTGFFEIVIVTHLYDVPQLKLKIRSSVLSNKRPLCCLAYHFFITLFSFQGSIFQLLLQPDLKICLYARSSNPTTNVVWWARVGSNHRPYDYQSYALAS